MSDIERQTQDSVQDLRQQLHSMPRDMRSFSLCIRALYSDQAVSTRTEGAIKFSKLRDYTRIDAMIYLKGILPLLTELLCTQQQQRAI